VGRYSQKHEGDSRQRRKATYLYLPEHEVETKEQMRRDGIIPPDHPPDRDLRREHTLEVRPFLQEWMDAIPEVSLGYQCQEGALPLPLDIQLLTDGCGSVEWYCIDEIELEDESFFACIGEHGEIGRKALDNWIEFKEGMRKFAETKRELVHEIRVMMEKKLGLPFHDKADFPKDRRSCFTWNYLLEMYRYRLSLVEEGREWRATRGLERRLREEIEYNKLLELYLYQPYGIWAMDAPGGRGKMEVLEEQERLRDQILGELEGDVFKERAQSIIDQKGKLESLRKRLIDRLEKMMSMPVLPGECSLLRAR